MPADNRDKEIQFRPLVIMGKFWFVFGIIILFATLYVKETPQVPLIRGIVTNIIAGILLLGTGLFCFIKGKTKK